MKRFIVSTVVILTTALVAALLLVAPASGVAQAPAQLDAPAWVCPEVNRPACEDAPVKVAAPARAARMPLRVYGPADPYYVDNLLSEAAAPAPGSSSGGLAPSLS